MSKLSPARRLLKLFHPEAIPGVGTAFYNTFSASRIFQRHYRWVASDILNYCPQGSILDVGTGPGWLLVRLHEQNPALQLTGIDISPSMVDKARKNVAGAGLGDALTIQEGQASSIPFLDNFFDAVVSTGSIHHWKDLTAGLNDIYRVLKVGGYALIYDLVSDTPADILKEATQEFGRLKVLMLWLHAYEEPFYSWKDFDKLARPTLFREGESHFVGATCCLTMKKEEATR